MKSRGTQELSGTVLMLLGILSFALAVSFAFGLRVAIEQDSLLGMFVCELGCGFMLFFGVVYAVRFAKR